MMFVHFVHLVSCFPVSSRVFCRIENYRSWGSWTTATSSGYVTSSTPAARRCFSALFTTSFDERMKIKATNEKAPSCCNNTTVVWSNKLVLSHHVTRCANRGNAVCTWSTLKRRRYSNTTRGEISPNLKEESVSVSYTDKYRNTDFNIAEVKLLETLWWWWLFSFSYISCVHLVHLHMNIFTFILFTPHLSLSVFPAVCPERWSVPQPGAGLCPWDGLQGCQAF